MSKRTKVFGLVVSLAILSLGSFVLFQNFALISVRTGTEVIDTPPQWMVNKKGAGAWYESQWVGPKGISRAKDRILKLNAKWYYTWGMEKPPTNSELETRMSELIGKIEKRETLDDSEQKELASLQKLFDQSSEMNRLAEVDNIPFVPMIWTVNEYRICSPDCGDRKQFDKEAIKEKLSLMTNEGKVKLKHLLLFNEPERDGENESKMSIDLGVAYLLAEKEPRSNLSILKDYVENIVGPSAVSDAISTNGIIQITDQILSRVDPYKRLIGSIGYHSYPDPVSKNLIPKDANPLNTSDSFYSDPAKVERAATKLAQNFLNGLLKAHRYYNRNIWITEFGVADWGATKCLITKTDCDTEGKPYNRISPQFVKIFLEKVLPTLYERTYVSKFAYFSNDPVYGEKLRTSAIFELPVKDEDISVPLTELGSVYANAAPRNSCFKGEYINPVNGNIVEFMAKSCGFPSLFSAGWYLFNDNGIEQYRRELTPLEAGYFPVNKNKNCERGRFLDSSRNVVVEYMSRACTGYQPAGWYSEDLGSGGIEYRRDINPTTEKVSSLWHYSIGRW